MHLALLVSPWSYTTYRGADGAGRRTPSRQRVVDRDPDVRSSRVRQQSSRTRPRSPARRGAQRPFADRAALADAFAACRRVPRRRRRPRAAARPPRARRAQADGRGVGVGAGVRRPRPRHHERDRRAARDTTTPRTASGSGSPSSSRCAGARVDEIVRRPRGAARPTTPPPNGDEALRQVCRIAALRIEQLVGRMSAARSRRRRSPARPARPARARSVPPPRAA